MREVINSKKYFCLCIDVSIRINQSLNNQLVAMATSQV